MQMDLMKVSKKQVQKQIKEMRKQMKNVPPEMRGMMAAMGGAAQDMALQMLDAAEAEVKKDPEASAKSMMEKFDVDGDGKVTKDEFLERANEVMFACESEREPLLRIGRACGNHGPCAPAHEASPHTT